MKNYLLLFGLGALLVMVSCKDDEEPTPPHEVGVWELDSYVFVNFPAGFESNEDLAFGVSQLSFGGVTFEDYTLTLVKDGTFILEIGVPGPDIEDEGTWELDDEELILEGEDSDLEWTVEKNEEDELWLSLETQSGFIPDIYYDTVTQVYRDYLETLTDAQLDSVGNVLTQTVSFDLVYIFERE